MFVLWKIHHIPPPEVHKREWLTPYKVKITVYYKTLSISVTISVTITITLMIHVKSCVCIRSWLSSDPVKDATVKNLQEKAGAGVVVGKIIQLSQKAVGE